MKDSQDIDRWAVPDLDAESVSHWLPITQDAPDLESDPKGQLNEGESERWNATVRSRQTLRGSVVLAVAGTKVTWSCFLPDGRFSDLRLEI